MIQEIIGDQQVQTCITCSANCKACTSNNTCVSCDDGFYIDADPVSGFASCKPCSPLCAKCLTATDCQQCLTVSHVYHAELFKCMPQADCSSSLSSYLDMQAMTCRFCLAYCQTCSSPTTCFSCQPTLFLAADRQSCSPACLPRQVANLQTKACLECPTGC